MTKLLEVIVTSLEDALEAQAGGADRLEVIRAAEHGGMTPSLDTVQQILDAVSIPIRVMLRENATMSVGQDLPVLLRDLHALSCLPLDGLVAGFVENGAIDERTMKELLAAAPGSRVTFHRAFEHVADPAAAVRILQQMENVDRILLRAVDFSDEALRTLQRQASPQIMVVAGTGMSSSAFERLALLPEIREIHVGRLAREPATVQGRVTRQRVRAIKSRLE